MRWKFLHLPILVIQTPLPKVSHVCIHGYWKFIISTWRFFEIKKFFIYRHKRDFNPKVICKLFLIELSAGIRDSSFLLESLSKAKIFPNFSAGNLFFFNRFWNERFSDRCRIILTVFLHEKNWYSHFHFFCFFFCFTA